MTSPKGLPIEGRLEDLENQGINLKPKFSTITPLGMRRRALDTNGGGYYLVSEAVAVEAGSTSSRIVITGHSIKVGDLIRITSSVNGIQEEEMFVDEVIDANTVLLAGDCSANLAAADEIDVYRFVTQRLTADGSSMATLAAAPLRINVVQGGSTTEEVITDNQDTPADTVPIPVRLMGTSNNISITSDELNVQLSHTGGTPDSTQIGDGTEIMQVNASGEAQVRDDDANTALGTVNTNLGTIETDIEAIGTLLTALNESLASIGNDEVRVVATSSALPTGAATEATLADVRTALQALDDVLVSGSNDDQLRVDVISSALPTGAAAETTLQGIRTAVELLDNAVNGSNQLEVAIADEGGLSSETTLAAALVTLNELAAALTSNDTDKLATESDQLPASLGPKTAAASLSVTMASDSKTEIDSDNVLAFARVDYSSSNVTTAAYTEIIGDIGATAGKKVIIFHASGTPLLLATGAAAAEADRMMVIPGGFNHPVEIEIAANARISVKAIGANVTSGQIIINVVG